MLQFQTLAAHIGFFSTFTRYHLTFSEMLRPTVVRCAVHSVMFQSTIQIKQDQRTSGINNGRLMVVINTHLLRTISIGTPGFTMAIFIHSLPRSTDMTATVTASTETHTAVQRPKMLRRTSNRQWLLYSERQLARRTKATAQCSVRGYQMNICIKNGKETM